MKMLVIHKNESICAVVLRLIQQQPDWDAVSTHCITEACKWFSEQHFDGVLLGSGLSDTEEATLRKYFQQKPSIPVIQHYGGGSGLLVGEIRYALEKGKVLG